MKEAVDEGVEEDEEEEKEELEVANRRVPRAPEPDR